MSSKKPNNINTFDGPVPFEWKSTPNAANTTTSLCSNNKTVLCGEKRSVNSGKFYFRLPDFNFIKGNL